METVVLFYVFAALAVISGLVVVFSRNIIYAAFSLLFTFLGMAGLYVLLSADFVAVAQIMVYVGGILILLVFGVMLTRKVTDVEAQATAKTSWPSVVLVGLLLGTLMNVLTKAEWRSVDSVPDIAGTTMELGELLMTTYIMPFEVAAILLLVAIMGAALIARR
ncbi:MAG TPA: NADH-quinone oxidoreductase subunit J [Bacteroidota bacterium]|nr:NADH-quinone oxidoreductase subunit J [Bacteroidota bacterium]